MIIAIDFDGTCVSHEYPDVGQDIGAVPVLQALSRQHQLILWTMRSGDKLQDAVDWFKRNNIELYGINENPAQHSWTQSPKAYANLYIDDAAFGCPLVEGGSEDRPYVNWHKVHLMLVSTNVL